MLQCVYELDGTSEAAESLIKEYYSTVNKLPYQIMLVWIQYRLSLQQYEECCRELMQYIDMNYSRDVHPSFNPPLPAANGPSAPSYHTPADSESRDTEYMTLLQLLLFHVLVPLGAHDEALQFLRRADRGRTRHRRPSAAVTSHGALAESNARDRIERIMPEVKEAWISELAALQSAHYTHAAGAAALLAPTQPAIAQAAQPPSTAFHAGLNALHDSTYYARTTTAAPSKLDSDADWDMHRIGQDGSEADEERHDAESTDEETALQPFDPPLPLMPDPWSLQFTWTLYTQSLGNRLYALIHARWPRLANRLRPWALWCWERRSVAFTLLAMLIAWRVLRFLVSFFNLGELPGVTLLVNEIRNLIKIAFISGTGRSIFG